MIYRGNALTWQNGRQLASYGSYSFTYNSDGLRIRKTNGNYTDINNDDDDDTVIYRCGDVFYPTSKDMYSFNGSSPGVSFALKPPTNTNTPYSVTTLNTLNNSGIFTAEVDGANHVSVRPTGVYGSMQSCYCDGENHPYSYALKGMTIKMK